MMRRLIGFSMLVLFLTSCKPQEELLREQRAADEAAAALENKPAMESQVAKTGVGIKGDSLEGTSSSNPASMVSAPALAYFKLKERVVFEIQLPKQIHHRSVHRTSRILLPRQNLDRLTHYSAMHKIIMILLGTQNRDRFTHQASAHKLVMISLWHQIHCSFMR